MFIPGRLDITEGATIGNWLNKDTLHKGLTSNEATQRLGVVGPNILDLKKPTVLGCIIREFSKPFYLYQNFMVWTWAPYWYYYMAIVQTVVRVSGGLVVSVFQYMADMDLYRLMVVDGTVQVVRDGELVTLNQTDVVPGKTFAESNHTTILAQHIHSQHKHNFRRCCQSDTGHCIL
jgi:cation-transporting ATPase 13A3/4/5